MAASLNANFVNNINMVVIRAEGSTLNRYTDRTATAPRGHSGALLLKTTEADAGVDKTGLTYTIGAS